MVLSLPVCRPAEAGQGLWLRVQGPILRLLQGFTRTARGSAGSQLSLPVLCAAAADIVHGAHGALSLAVTVCMTDTGVPDRATLRHGMEHVRRSVTVLAAGATT